ncbi:MAG: DUF4190 domain-containing protein [Candidatus Woesearchaeota archaeon]
MAEEQKRTNVMAILSLVFAFIFPILGAIFGIIALIQIRDSGEEGRVLAIIGLIVSGIYILLALLMFLAFFGFAFSMAAIAS